MFKRTKVCIGVLSAIGGGFALQPVTVLAQSSERIEITGSAIRRIDAETAVPVTVIRLEELKKQGVTTIEQVLANISAVQIQQGTSQTVGSGTGGDSFADLRALGANKTLVLLNGRRIANSAFDSSAPDLNAIPFAALERVEVLRDGASALYGSDAVGGVINFITRRDFTGGTLTVGADVPDKKGGRSINGNVGFGYGDLNADRFNVFGFIDYQRQKPLSGTDRNFNLRQPGGLSPTTFPANYFQDDASGNPAATQPGGCEATANLISDGGTGCFISTSRFVDYIPKSERLSIMLKGAFKINEGLTAGLEYFGTRKEVTTHIAPVPYGNAPQNRVLADGTLNPYYPGNPGSSITTPNITLDPTFAPPASRPDLLPGFITTKFRNLAGGNRIGNDVGKQHRLLATLDGTAVGWDYQGAVAYNRNTVKDSLDGYSDGGIILPGIRDGVINPFGAQTAAGDALIASANLSGQLQEAKGTVAGADFRASRELGDWLRAGRPAALALGVEGRHEKFRQAAIPEFASRVIASTGIDPNTLNEGSRNIYAAYAELNVPLLKELEVTASVRYDKYSDSGSTTNPKFTFRYEPIRQLLFRGSASTGFRAPSLYDLNQAQAFTNTSQFDDPVRCPGGNPIPGAPRATNCQQQFQTLQGGNQDLKPEKSKSASFGIVVEPVKDASFGVDYFWVILRNQINALTDVTVFGNPTQFSNVFVRAPDGSLSTDGTLCPGPDCGYVDLRTQNLGKVKTSGLDLSATYRLGAGTAGNFSFGMNTTYVLRYEYQDFAGGPYNENRGVYSGAGPIFRWQSNASLLWTGGAFGAGIFAHYKSGYVDQDPSNHVASYTTFDVYGSWSPIKAVSLTLGIRNALDRDPPFSNQTAVFQANYDPRFTDPLGRTYYVRGTYSF